MSKIVSRTNGAVRRATGGTNVKTHGEGSDHMYVGDTRRPTGGAAVKTTPQQEAHRSSAMKMSQPFGTTGKTV